MKFSTIANTAYLVHALASTAVVSAKVVSNGKVDEKKKSSLMITAAFQGFDESAASGSNFNSHEKNLAESCLVATFNLVHFDDWQMEEAIITKDTHDAVDDKNAGPSTDLKYTSLFTKFMSNYVAATTDGDLGQSGCNRYCPGDEYSLSDFYETSIQFHGVASQSESKVAAGTNSFYVPTAENSDAMKMTAAELTLLANHRAWEEHFCSCLVDFGVRGSVAADKCIIAIDKSFIFE